MASTPGCRTRSIRSLAISIMAAILAHLPMWMCSFRLTLRPSWCLTRSACRGILVIPTSTLPSRTALALSVGPDFAATLTAVARLALNSVWYQKWAIHLRHRPESGGAIVRQMLTGHGGTLQGHVNNNVLNSQAVQSSFNRYGDYFLSQAFPEGSPTHPAYPTGHGTVAGACITVLKFFFDGNFVIPNPVVPGSDGLSLQPYTGGDAGQITVNGELNKIANNISFGHGIHSGIHWRSDTSSSIQLGEAVAISMLQDRARCYAERFTVSLTKIDGTTATISN